jgi:hypothetical protein
MFSDLSIRAKIICVAAVLLATTIGMGLLAVKNMRSINANTLDITTNWLPSIRVLGDLRAGVITYRNVVREHMLAEQTSKATGEIGQQISGIQEISRNVQQAAHGTQQVSSNITDVQRGATETGSASSQVLSAAKSLSGDSARLRAEVSKFLTSESGRSQPAIGWLVPTDRTAGSTEPGINRMPLPILAGLEAASFRPGGAVRASFAFVSGINQWSSSIGSVTSSV